MKNAHIFKKAHIPVSVAALLLFLCACSPGGGGAGMSAVSGPVTGGASVQVSGTPAAQESGAAAETTGVPSPRTPDTPRSGLEPAFAAYRSVLLDNAPFCSMDFILESPGDIDDTGNLDQILRYFDQMLYSDYGHGGDVADKFAVADLDGDGTPEVILSISDYFTEILHYENGAVYGYDLPYRSFLELKTDGSFFSSDGTATDLAVATIRFSADNYTIDTPSRRLQEYGPDGLPGIFYYVDDVSATEDAFNAASDRQGGKPDADWHDFTDDNLSAILTPTTYVTSVIIKGQHYGTGLTELNLNGLRLDASDIEPLKYMTNLTTLGLGADTYAVGADGPVGDRTAGIAGTNDINDISSLAGLTSLTHLDLQCNALSDISPLAGLTGLEFLDLGYNKLSDIGALKDLTNLTDLTLWGNQITDITPLAGLTELTRLDLYGNQISDVSALMGLTNLTYLCLAGNPLSQTQIADLQAALPNCEIDIYSYSNRLTWGP